jgi:hypothetical protein
MCNQLSLGAETEVRAQLLGAQMLETLTLDRIREFYSVAPSPDRKGRGL